jgi:acyl carrier protein
MATIKERVIKCVENRFPSDLIDSETNFYHDLGIDSLGMLELVMDIEDEFNVNIPEKYIADAPTVGDVIRLLTSWSNGVIDNAD